MVNVERVDDGPPMVFRVGVRERGGATSHRVTLAPETLDELTGGAASAEALLEAAFEFLLEREPKESILARFDVTVISRYFPEFPAAMQRRFR